MYRKCISIYIGTATCDEKYFLTFTGKLIISHDVTNLHELLFNSSPSISKSKKCFNLLI